MDSRRIGVMNIHYRLLHLLCSQAILGFIRVMQLVRDTHLYAVRTKAMALLKLALTEPNPTEYVVGYA